MNEELFNTTFLPDERALTRAVLEHIIGYPNGKNTRELAIAAGCSLGMARLVIKRGCSTGLIQFDGPPLKYFVG